jgi:hypothetical protein
MGRFMLMFGLVGVSYHEHTHSPDPRYCGRAASGSCMPSARRSTYSACKPSICSRPTKLALAASAAVSNLINRRSYTSCSASTEPACWDGRAVVDMVRVLQGATTAERML